MRFFSRELKRRIEYGEGEPTDFKEPRARKIVNRELEPGAERVAAAVRLRPGFTITYWRKVYRGDDLIRDETFVARYKPEDAILEIGPEDAEAAEARPTGDDRRTGDRAPATGGTTTAATRGAGTDAGAGRARTRPPAAWRAALDDADARHAGGARPSRRRAAATPTSTA